MCSLSRAQCLGLIYLCLQVSLTPFSLCDDEVNASEVVADVVNEHVVTLTSLTFDDFIERNSVVLVQFYAPWCGHCKNMAPDYEKAASILHDMGSEAKLAKVDATAETKLGDLHEIRGFPTLKFFKNKVPRAYNGGRQSQHIIDWIESMTGPAVIIMKPSETAESIIGDDNLVIFVGYFSSITSEQYVLFEAVADISRDVAKFYAKVDEKNTDEIYVHRHEEGYVKFEGKTQDDLKTFVHEESLPFFGPINADNFQRYHDMQGDLVWFCGTPDHFGEAKHHVRPVSKETKGGHVFVWLNTDGYQLHAERALGMNKFPGVALQSKVGRYLYPEYATHHDSAKIRRFLSDVKEGKIEKSLRSENAPESNDEPVKVVVGKTFLEMVFQSNKDVFLEVYAPWCGHCKKLAPIYEKFAASHADNKRLEVTKMDGAANESPVENFDWTGFPTIFFVKAGTKEPIKYDGERTTDALETFYQDNKTGSAHTEL